VKILWRYVKPFSSDTGTLRTDGQTDRRTDLLYQYRASVCWRAIKIFKCRHNVCRTGKPLVVFRTFLTVSAFSRQMANCSTLEELQYEKQVHRDGDDCIKRISRCCRPNARWLGGRELRHVAACQWCKTMQDRLALGIPRDCRAWTRYVPRLVTCGVRSVHQWRGLVGEGHRQHVQQR